VQDGTCRRRAQISSLFGYCASILVNAWNLKLIGPFTLRQFFSCLGNRGLEFTEVAEEGVGKVEVLSPAGGQDLWEPGSQTRA